MKKTNGNKLKLPFQAGIIDIGAHSVRLEIFQVGQDGQYEILETLNQAVNLGYDVFRKGVISSGNINLACAIMEDFAAKLQEYNIQYCRTVATSAVREAFNREILINRVKICSGLNIEVLGTPEEARLLYLAMKELVSSKYDFNHMNTFTFAIGTGSLIVMFSSNGRLKYVEAAALGTVRIFDEFGRSSINPEQILDLIEAFDLRKRFADTAGFDEKLPLTLIGLGAGVRALVNTRKKLSKLEIAELSPPEFDSIIDDIQYMSPETLVEKFNIPDHLAMSIAPCGHILDYFLKELHCNKLIFPAISTRDALIADIIRLGAPGRDPFVDDILSVAATIGRKYHFEEEHAYNVAGNCLKIFDKIKKMFGLSNRSRVLLEVAALLHDIGRFVDTRKHHKHSYYLISNIQLPGISEREQLLIAAMSRYHRKSTPKTSHPEYMMLLPEEKVTVCTLAAILRVGDALDRAHDNKFKNMTLSLKENILTFKVSDSHDLSLEHIYLKNKSDLFGEVFGLKTEIEGEPVKL